MNLSGGPSNSTNQLVQPTELQPRDRQHSAVIQAQLATLADLLELVAQQLATIAATHVMAGDPDPCFTRAQWAADHTQQAAELLALDRSVLAIFGQ